MMEILVVHGKSLPAHPIIESKSTDWFIYDGNISRSKNKTTCSSNYREQIN